MGSPIFSEGLVNGFVWNLCGQKAKEDLENSPSLPFLDNLEGMKTRTFEGEQHTIQSLKDSFLANPYMWSHGYLLVDGLTGPHSLIDFIDCLYSKS